MGFFHPRNLCKKDDPKTRSLLLYDVNMNCINSMNEAHKSIKKRTKQHRQYAYNDNKLITEFVQDGLHLWACFSIGGSIYNLNMKEKYMAMIQ